MAQVVQPPETDPGTMRVFSQPEEGPTAVPGHRRPLRAGLHAGDHQPALRPVDQGLRRRFADDRPSGPLDPPGHHPGVRLGEHPHGREPQARAATREIRGLCLGSVPGPTTSPEEEATGKKAKGQAMRRKQPTSFFSPGVGHFYLAVSTRAKAGPTRRHALPGTQGRSCYHRTVNFKKK